jgi:cysteine desulfurase
MKPAFETSLGSWENNFGHECDDALELGFSERVRRGVCSYIGAGVHVAIGRKSAVLSGSERLYLDHAATTPVLPQARAALAEALTGWANPSSPHADGRRLRAALEADRRAFASLLGWRHDVIFTSGASEAIHIAAARSRLKRRVLSPTEHPAVTAAMGAEATQLEVDANGLVDLPHLATVLELGPALVAIQCVNNETGVIQPITEIQQAVRTTGSTLLADCAQAAGKISLPEADFIAISGHKLGGPPGVGALLVRDLAHLEASGGQERGYRRGTENWPSIAAMTAALRSSAFLEAMPRLSALRHALEQEIESAGGMVIAKDAPRIATIGAYGMPGFPSATQLVQLDLAGISVSAGSACSSGSMKASPVLKAMRLPPEIAGTVIRVSFGPDTNAEHIDRFLSEWRKITARARTVAA